MLRIKKLDIFIAKQFGLLFMGTFFICQFVLMMQFLWRYIDDLIGKGISMDVMAQFFWYMGLMLVPQALPLAILLSSLMTFGNLGESSELTAIKAAGISLMQAFRSLIVITVIIMFGSFYFQNNVGPHSNQKLAQLLISMKQKSPELEIPEGIFYDGIPNCNLYVQKKDLKTGKLYGIMIYRMTNSYEDAAIILADSGMLQSTAEKKHLVLTLNSGEWFENMQSSEFGNSAAVPSPRKLCSTSTAALILPMPHPSLTMPRQRASQKYSTTSTPSTDSTTPWAETIFQKPTPGSTAWHQSASRILPGKSRRDRRRTSTPYIIDYPARRSWQHSTMPR